MGWLPGGSGVCGWQPPGRGAWEGRATWEKREGVGAGA